MKALYSFIHSFYFNIIPFAIGFIRNWSNPIASLRSIYFFKLVLTALKYKQRQRKHNGVLNSMANTTNKINQIEKERLQQSTITNDNIRESASCNCLSQQR